MKKYIISPPIRVGISSCLLGQKVRYNGDHKRNQFVVDVLGDYFEWVPVCPEVEIGLGVPRDTLRLVKQSNEKTDTRLIVTKTGEDLTERMETYSVSKIVQLDVDSLHGYILKKGSPSCGLERVSIYASNGIPEKKGSGLFAKQLMKHLPLLPLEEEGRLSDITLRLNWLERVFAYHRLTQLITSKPTKNDIVFFHTCHKMQLLSHNHDMYSQLGKMVAEVETASASWMDEYAGLFMQTLAVHTTKKKNANILYHLMSYLKKSIAPIDKQELVEKIEAYRLGKVSLVAPITLLKHHFLHHPIQWIMNQTYLNLYPEDLNLF